jgi:hypothetical protein
VNSFLIKNLPKGFLSIARGLPHCELLNRKDRVAIGTLEDPHFRSLGLFPGQLCALFLLAE